MKGLKRIAMMFKITIKIVNNREVLSELLKFTMLCKLRYYLVCVFICCLHFLCLILLEFCEANSENSKNKILFPISLFLL